jgi:polygalacturonase
MRDGPSWNVHLVYCQDVLVSGITLQGQETQGCDGVVIDSCKRVHVTSSSIGSGADCISLKSGYNEDGRRVAVPCEDVVITNCNLFRSYASAVAIGSETAAGVKNVTIDNCVMVDCRTGIYIRSPRGRGGVIQRIRCTNLIIDRATDAAVRVSHFWDSVRMEGRFGEGTSTSTNPEVDRSSKPAPTEATPEIRDIEFSGLTIGDTTDVAIIEGLPERFIHGVTLRDVNAPRARAGVSARRVADLVISGLQLNPAEAPAVAARDIERLEVHRLKSSRPLAKLPLLRLENVAGAAIRDCDVVDGGGGFVKQEGAANRGVVLAGNNVAVATAPVENGRGKK